MLKIQDASQAFRSQTVFKQANFEVARGERIAVVGENGAGKTTLLHAILGFSRVPTGSITISGTPVHKQGSWQGKCSYLPEKFQLYTQLSVLENVQYMTGVLQLSTNEVKRALSFTGMWDHRFKRVSQLSKGMLQRTGLSIAIIGNPNWLVMDEPSSGLDPFGRSKLLMLLKQIVDDHKTILFTTHQMEEVRQLATHVLYLHNQRVEKMETAHFFQTVGRSFI